MVHERRKNSFLLSISDFAKAKCRGRDRGKASSSQPSLQSSLAPLSTPSLPPQSSLAPPSLPFTSNPLPLLPDLPFELLVEILCRLPVKTLLKLRCVCKSWNSLISDKKFAKKHLRCSPKDFTRHHIILSNTRSICEFLPTSYPLQSVLNTVNAPATQPEDTLYVSELLDLIVGSCNGILCYNIDQSSPLLWNPSTRIFKKLPYLGNPQLRGRYTCTQYGFGYDHFTDRYKVVAIFCYKCDNGTEKTIVRVHTLGTGDWRNIQDFPHPTSGPDDPGKFVSGTINWLVSGDCVIISLDLANECYQELLQPDYGLDGGNMFLTLGVLRDCLCSISSHGTFSDVWLMKEYGNQESWTKLFTMMLVPEPFYPNLLHISEDDEVLLLEFDGELLLYNSRDATFKAPQIQDIDGPMVAEVYVESLISPCMVAES